MKGSCRILTGKATSKMVASTMRKMAQVQDWVRHSLEELSASMVLMMLDVLLSEELWCCPLNRSTHDVSPAGWFGLLLASCPTQGGVADRSRA